MALTPSWPNKQNICQIRGRFYPRREVELLGAREERRLAGGLDSEKAACTYKDNGIVFDGR